MREEVTTIPSTETIRRYIADDGTEFYSRFSAVMHEAKEMRRLHPRKIKSTSILTPDDQYINLYKVESLEDWNYLYKVAWEQNAYGNYLGPAWYGTIRHDGGDYPDEYEIIHIPIFIKQYDNFLNEIKDLTSE